MELVTLKDCLLPKTFELWETFNYQTRANLLKEILDKDKNLEVWVPFEYFYLRYLPIKPTDKTYCKAEELLISNKGRVYNHVKGELRNLKIASNGYPMVTRKVKRKVSTFLIHRALACLFIPLSEEQNKIPFALNILQINHKDGDKLNFDLDNLEWCTGKQNIEHSVSTGLRKYLLGEANKDSRFTIGIVLEGPFKGTKFMLRGKSEMRKHGFNNSCISLCCKGVQQSHRKCKWIYSTETDSTEGIHPPTSELLETLFS